MQVHCNKLMFLFL